MCLFISSLSKELWIGTAIKVCDSVTKMSTSEQIRKSEWINK